MSYFKGRGKAATLSEDSTPAQAEKSKPEALAAKIQEIEKFLAARFPSEETQEIQQTLSELRASLKAEKRVVQVISEDLAQAQALQKLLDISQLVSEAYQTKIAPLPKLPAADTSFPTLVWQAADAGDRYELSNPTQQTIGRNPDQATLLVPNSLCLVSGCHAELQFTDNRWQIRDYESKNGTYINGRRKKLQGWHVLEAGDQISLGSPGDIEGSAVFVFEQDERSANLAGVDRLLDCDVLCLVIDPSQPLSEAAQQLLAQAEMHVTKLFLVAAVSGEASNATLESLALIQQWVENQSSRSSIELVSLLLQPVLPKSRATVLIPYAQPEFEQFCQTLITLAHTTTDDAVLNRVTAQLLTQIGAIETLINQKTVKLNRRIQQDEEKLQELGQSTLKDLAKKAIDIVDDEVAQFFRRIKNDVSQSKNDLLYKSRANSLPHKIQQFIQKLQSVITLKKGYCSIRFEQKRSADVHATAVYLYQSELKAWATAEWRRICQQYKDGGLHRLIASSYRTLNAIPGFSLPTDLFQPPQTIDIEPVLQVATLPPECGFKISYKQPGFMGHLYKKLKGEILSLVALIAIIGAPIALFAGSSFSEHKSKISLLMIVPVSVCLYINYREEKAAKAEEMSEKLQKELVSYYQQRTEDFADRAAQHLSSMCEAEERKLQKTLSAVKEQYASYLSELEKHQLPLKAQLERDKKVQLKQLEDAAAELVKLKGGLSTAGSI